MCIASSVWDRRVVRLEYWGPASKLKTIAKCFSATRFVSAIIPLANGSLLRYIITVKLVLLFYRLLLASLSSSRQCARIYGAVDHSGPALTDSALCLHTVTPCSQ